MAKKKEKDKGFIWLALGAGALFALSGGRSDSSSPGSSGSGTDSPNRPWNEADLRNAFQKAAAAFGQTIAGQTEQIYRKETRNFDSGQFAKTYTPGMEQAPGKDDFPYGWGSLNDFLAAYPKYKGNFFLATMTENNTGKIKKFVAFPTLEGAVMFVAYTVKRRGNPGYWRAWDEQIAAAYAESLKAYPIKYT